MPVVEVYCAKCGYVPDGPVVAHQGCPNDHEPLLPIGVQDLLGRKLGEYRVLGKIGGGAYGTVYRAAHVTTRSIVAIKLLNQPIDHADSQRVVIEARAATKIAHPSCVEVFDLQLTSDRRPYIVMQLLDGVPLSKVMRQRLSVAEALTLACDVLDGIGAAHRQGVVHRDIKPGNIFVTNGRAVIVDFGFAKLLSDPKAPNLSITGEVIGTPAYMAPEQIKAGRTVDGRTDLYAVAVMLYEMLANRLPFTAKTPLLMMAAHVNTIAAPITGLRPDVPKRIGDAIARGMRKDPGERFQTAHEMRAALTMKGPVWPYLVLAAMAAAIVIGIARACS